MKLLFDREQPCSLNVLRAETAVRRSDLEETVWRMERVTTNAAVYTFTHVRVFYSKEENEIHRQRWGWGETVLYTRSFRSLQNLTRMPAVDFEVLVNLFVPKVTNI